MERYRTPKAISAGELCYQDARLALSAIGFTPLCAIGRCEHWVRDNKRVILIVDAPLATDAICSETMLSGSTFVDFAKIGKTLVAFV